MKKLLTFSAAAMLAVSVFGQGQVAFNTRDLVNGLTAQVKDKDGNAISGTAARIALLGGTTTTAAAVIDRAAGTYNAGGLSVLASPVGSFTTWVNFQTGTKAGYAAVGSDQARVVPTVAYGGNAQLQLVAWTGNFTDWASAFAAAQTDTSIWVGCSTPWTVKTTLSENDTGFALNTGMAGFSIAPIPEPTTMALAGLGAAALLIFRRRK